MSNSLKNKLKHNLNSLKQNLSAAKYLYREENNTNSAESFMSKFHLNFKGYTSEKPGLYQTDLKNDLYLSDFQRFKTQFINGKYTILLDNKLITTKYLQDYHALPTVFGQILNGKILLQKQKANFNDFLLFLKEKKSVMLKKIIGGGGKGVYRLDYDESGLTLDHKAISIEQLKEFVLTLNEFYISEVIVQANYSSRVFPNTVNTMRVLMLKDPSTKRFFIGTAIHKFGSSTTGSADNVWRGGLTSQVNLDTGILSKPVHHLKNNRDIKWVEEHPDTLEKIQGVQVPNWDKVKSQIIQMSNEFVMLDYIGWDAVVTDEGVRIIEGNNYSEVSILQIHEPLLANQRVRKFYRHHKIIK